VRQLIGDMRFVTGSLSITHQSGYQVMNDIGVTTGKPGDNWRISSMDI
jgi:hypothetical protein